MSRSALPMICIRFSCKSLEGFGGAIWTCVSVVFFVGTLFLLYFFVGRSLAANGGGVKKMNESFCFTSILIMFHSVFVVVCCTQTPQMRGPFLLLFSQSFFSIQTFSDNMNNALNFWSVKPSV